MFTCAALRFKPISTFPEKGARGRGRCARTRAVGRAFVVKNKVEWHLGKVGTQTPFFSFPVTDTKRAKIALIEHRALLFSSLRCLLANTKTRVRFIQSLLASLLIFTFSKIAPSGEDTPFFLTRQHVN
jgi:hypothetical protein